MINGRPLFPGASEQDQLNKIFKVLGTPTLAQWPGMASLPEYKTNFPSLPVQSWKRIVRKLDKDQLGVDLLSRMLQYDPAKRISADVALKHPWFRDLKVKGAAAQPLAFPSGAQAAVAATQYPPAASASAAGQ
jgi:serine/threonine protein kinase